MRSGDGESGNMLKVCFSEVMVTHPSLVDEICILILTSFMEIPDSLNQPKLRHLPDILEDLFRGETVLYTSLIDIIYNLKIKYP